MKPTVQEITAAARLLLDTNENRLDAAAARTRYCWNSGYEQETSKAYNDARDAAAASGRAARAIFAEIEKLGLFSEDEATHYMVDLLAKARAAATTLEANHDAIRRAEKRVHAARE
jgi:spermidine/putrescine-binding protein